MRAASSARTAFSRAGRRRDRIFSRGTAGRVSTVRSASTWGAPAPTFRDSLASTSASSKSKRRASASSPRCSPSKRSRPAEAASATSTASNSSSARQAPAPIPGPACYGRGGPLTVTDANLFLGQAAARAISFPARSRRGRISAGRISADELPLLPTAAALSRDRTGARLHRRRQCQHGPRDPPDFRGERLRPGRLRARRVRRRRRPARLRGRAASWASARF